MDTIYDLKNYTDNQLGIIRRGTFDYQGFPIRWEITIESESLPEIMSNSPVLRIDDAGNVYVRGLYDDDLTNERLKCMGNEKRDPKIVLEYHTAHSDGCHIVEGSSIIDCLNQLDKRIKKSVTANPHIMRYEIESIKFFGINKTKDSTSVNGDYSFEAGV